MGKLPERTGPFCPGEGEASGTALGLALGCPFRSASPVEAVAKGPGRAAQRVSVSPEEGWKYRAEGPPPSWGVLGSQRPSGMGL